MLRKHSLAKNIFMKLRHCDWQSRRDCNIHTLTTTTTTTTTAVDTTNPNTAMIEQVAWNKSSLLLKILL